MPLAFYMDQHVPRAITVGLRLRGVEVLTAYEDGAGELEDVKLLDRASQLERVLFTCDDDLLAEATKRHRGGLPFYGIVHAHQLRVSIGRCVEDLELIALIDGFNPCSLWVLTILLALVIHSGSRSRVLIVGLTFLAALVAALLILLVHRRVLPRLGLRIGDDWRSR